MQTFNWSGKTCKVEYQLDLPIKISASHPIVVLNVPSQRNEHTLTLKRIKARLSIDRTGSSLFCRRRRPLNKVCLNFSTYTESSSILKSRHILLDDNNIAFTVEPYQASTRVLRHYNCQAYNDHIAAHSSNKSDDRFHGKRTTFT